DNDQVLAHLLDALVRVPADLAAGAVANIAGWASRTYRFYDPLTLARFMDHLFESGHEQEAFLVLEALFEPIEPAIEGVKQETARHFYQPKARVDGFWLKEIW